MWIYEKKLQYPVKIKTPNPKLANLIISQLGGPDGELAASMRYLHQRFSMPNKKVSSLLTDIGIEDYFCLSHIFIQDNTGQFSTPQEKTLQQHHNATQPTTS